MTEFKYMSPEWVKEFNKKPYEVKLGLFKGFTTWQRLMYLTTPVSAGDEEMVRFRTECRSLMAKPDIYTAIVAIDYSLVRRNVWDEPEI